MNGPGVSLFQGSVPLTLDNSNQKEEEEFLEDEKIRRAELHDLINEHFNDQDEENDSSIASSHCDNISSTQYSVDEKHCSKEISSISDFSQVQKQSLENHCYQMPLENKHVAEGFHHIPFRGNNYDLQQNENYNSPHKSHCFQVNHSKQNGVLSSQLEVYNQAELNGVKQLKVMYDVRFREIEKLKNDLEAEREEKEHILRKLNVTEHDMKQLEQNLSTSQVLLSESRNQIMELEKEISKLNKNINVVETSRDQFKNELEIAKEQLLHEQQKYIALERSDINIKRGKQMDLVIDSINTKHKTEINFLQQQLDSAIERINRKEDDYKNLEKKLEEMEQKHAANLLNKCDSSMRQEATVKALLDQTNKEKLELSKKISSLQQECTMLRSDLEQYETFPKLKLNENSSSEEKETDSFTLLSSTWKNDSKRKSMNLLQTDVVNKLKEELHRALIGQRTKRHEIKKLQEQIELRDRQVAKMKEKEQIYAEQTESLKEDMNKLLEQANKARNKVKEAEQAELISSLQAEMAIADNEIFNKTKLITELKGEIEKLIKEKSVEIELSNKKKVHESEIEKLKKEYDVLLRDKELEWGREMEKLMTECDEVKQLYLDIKDSKEKMVESVIELKDKYEYIQKEKQTLQDQLSIKEENIKYLHDHITQLMKEKNSAEEANNLQEEYRHISEKQKGELDQLKSKLKNFVETEEEIKILKNEISQSKQRYMDLERTIKSQFETEMLRLIDENSKLQECLKKKEAEISLRKICSIQKKDMATETDDSSVIESLYEQNQIETSKLEKEIDRLKKLEEDKSNEILSLKASYEKKLDEELQSLENEINAKYQNELLLAENRVKELSLKYFSEEIEKLQMQHTKELQSLREQESKNVIQLKNYISEKEKEVNNLESKIQELNKLINTYEEERDKAAMMMMQWVKEVENLKTEKERIFKEYESLKYSNNQLLSSLDETKLKLKETRKAALVYKRRLNEIKCELSEKYTNLLLEIQQKVDGAVAEKQMEIETKLNEIEKEYKTKERKLKSEYENRFSS